MEKIGRSWANVPWAGWRPQFVLHGRSGDRPVGPGILFRKADWRAWEDSRTWRARSMAGSAGGIRRGHRQARSSSRLEIQREDIEKQQGMTRCPARID
jgi:hypothetical protein